MPAETIHLDGGRVVCPATGTDEVRDLWIRNGVIVGAPEDGDRVTVIDCSGKVVAPGFTDMGAEICDPGTTRREDLRSGSEAGAAGGFTTIVASPRTDPVLDTPVAISDTLGRCRAVSGARIELAGALTVGLDGEHMSELGLMVEAGAVALSDGRKPMMNAAMLRRSLDYARPFDVPVMLRPGDTDLEGAGVMHEGEVSTQIGLRGIPAAAEEIGVAKGVALARLTGAKVHLSQVTTAGSVDMLRTAKAAGIRVTASVPARHLVLTDREVDQSVYSTATRLLPPLRSVHDRDAIRAGVVDGTLDCVGADHVPMTSLEKELEYMHAKPGAMGLETAFSAALTAIGDIRTVVQALAVGPARVLGREAQLSEGTVADVVVLDVDAKRTVAGPYRSKGLNEPLEGMVLAGQVVATIRDGCIIYGPHAE